MGMPVEPIRLGTIRKPPPMPKKPDSIPVAVPVPISLGALRAVRITCGSPAAERPRSIRAPTTSISTANRASSFCPSTAFPRLEPRAAPTTPAAANSRAIFHFTAPWRAWFSRLAKALAATAKALVPMARWGSFTPTR